MSASEWSTGKIRLMGVMCVRNEARWLPGLLAHLEDHVDAFLAFDDGSTDGTRDVLARHPKMLDVIGNPPVENHVWREDLNRARLLSHARELGAQWVLAIDPDERLELTLARNLRRVCDAAESFDKALVVFRNRELWDSPLHYRIDGLWGRKLRERLFRMPDAPTFGNFTRLHGPWHPHETEVHGRPAQWPGNIYHLKMVRRDWREARRDLYNGLDPTKEFQKWIGYDYLTNERGLALAKIPPWRSYDLSTLPDMLRDAPAEVGSGVLLRGAPWIALNSVQGVLRVVQSTFAR